MSDSEKLLQALLADLDKSWQKLRLDEKLAEQKSLEATVSNPDLWRDPDSARQANESLAKLSAELEPWLLLRTQLSDIKELLALNDDSLKDEISAQLQALATNLADQNKALRYTGPYDDSDAILRITAGVGGTEAMDWASMLERMYLRYAEKSGLKSTCLERISGEEVGIKTAVYELSGVHAYGRLRSEHGVHRLVRLSPFNANNLRQTSFALVEILPILKNPDSVHIDDKDLRIDVYHSGGHGGQSVNTTNSAVRITHLPTNTVVAIQNERSQLRNKEKAMEILLAKLTQMQQEQHSSRISDLRAGESAKWGQQIRNYVLQPYKLVKDTRTKHEETDVEKVLDGDIDPFIEAFLDMGD